MSSDVTGIVGEDVIEAVLARMRAAGGRATPARRLLLRALVEGHGHQSAEELAARIHVTAPDINLSTIYRNLEELEKLSVVDRTEIGHGPATYHLVGNTHGHLLCEQCGSLTEVPDDAFTALAAVLLREHGFAIEPRHLAVTGRCASCRQPGPSSGPD